MKNIHKMAVAALLAFSSAGIASATTYHVSGSTAFRTAVIQSEIVLCGGTGAKATYYQNATVQGSASVTGASYSVIETGSDNGATLKFENSFTGSVAGDSAIVTASNIDFPTATGSGETPTAITTAPALPTGPSNGGTKAAGGTGLAAPTPAASGPNSRAMFPYASEQKPADIIFSDVYFSTAQQVLNSIGITATPTATALSTTNTDNIVGIIPFCFVANAGTDVTDLASMNVDPQKVTYLYGNGVAPLSLFTGNNSDESVLVYALGRDLDSGTRATALAETGDGLNGSGNITTPVIQYFPYNTSANFQSDAATADGPNDDQFAGFSVTTGVIGQDTNAGTTTGYLGLVPEETIDGVQLGDGDGGYYSGLNLSIAMGSKVSLAKTVMFAYLGQGDSKNAENTPGAGQLATILPYNGVTWDPKTPSQANSALIYEGKYTFWSYEHEYYTTSGRTEGVAIANQLLAGYDQFSSNNVTLTGMEVARSGDGQNVQPSSADTAYTTNENNIQ